MRNLVRGGEYAAHDHSRKVLWTFRRTTWPCASHACASPVSPVRAVSALALLMKPLRPNWCAVLLRTLRKCLGGARLRIDNDMSVDCQRLNHRASSSPSPAQTEPRSLGACKRSE